MKRILASLFALFLFVAPVAGSFNRILESVQPLKYMRNGELTNGCTSTSINQEKQYWLTAAHCVDEPVYIGDELAVVTFADAQTDLAVLQTQKHPTKALKLRQTKPQWGEGVSVVGHPLGFSTPLLFKGYIAAPYGDYGYMWLDMESCAGNSGSSVIDNKDRVVGVVQVNSRGFGTDCSGLTGGSLWPTLVKQVGKFFQK